MFYVCERERKREKIGRERVNFFKCITERLVVVGLFMHQKNATSLARIAQVKILTRIALKMKVGSSLIRQKLFLHN